MPLQQTTRLFEIKLSGIDGLASRFFGDVDRTVSTPNLRVANQDNQDATSGSNRTMAEGIYNPFRRYGYLSPSNSSFVTVQVGSSNNSTHLCSSSVWDNENGCFYLAERGNQMWSSGSPDDVNLTSHTTAHLGVQNIITDLEIYQVNGIRKLFYSFYDTSDTVTGSNVGGNLRFTTVSGTSIGNNTPVTFSVIGGSLPTGVSAGTTYFTINEGTTAFNVSATLGGSSVAYTNSGSGTITVSGNFGGIGIADPLTFNNKNDDWASVTATGAFNLGANSHVMIPSDNSFMYVLDGNAVHKVDGTIASGGSNGTITANVLYFPPYFNLIDAIDYRGNLLIALHQFSVPVIGVNVDNTLTSYTSKCAVYIWDKLSSSAGAKDYVPLPGIKEIHKIYSTDTGVVRLIGVTSDNITVIQEYDGSNFKTIQEVGYKSWPAFLDSFTRVSSYVMWLGNDGFLYAHGNVGPTDPEGLFKLGQVASVAQGGALVYGGGHAYTPVAGYKTFRSGLVICYNNGSSNLLKQWDIHGTGASGSAAANMNAGHIFTPVYYLTEVLGFTHYPSPLATLNYINIYMTPTADTSSANTVVTINLYLNQSTSPFASYPITADKASRGYYRMEVNAQYVNAIQLEIVFPANTIGGTDDVGLSTAVLVYEPTNTKG